MRNIVRPRLSRIRWRARCGYDSETTCWLCFSRPGYATGDCASRLNYDSHNAGRWSLAARASHPAPIWTAVELFSACWRFSFEKHVGNDGRCDDNIFTYFHPIIFVSLPRLVLGSSSHVVLYSLSDLCLQMADRGFLTSATSTGDEHNRFAVAGADV